MNTSRRVSIPIPLYDRLEKVSESRLIGINLIVAKSVEKFLDALESEPELP